MVLFILHRVSMYQFILIIIIQFNDIDSFIGNIDFVYV